jgi:hypothetical protein
MTSEKPETSGPDRYRQILGMTDEALKLESQRDDLPANDVWLIDDELSERALAVEDLNEQVRDDGAEWTVKSPRGADWVMRWFTTSETVAAWKFPSGGKPVRRPAVTLVCARCEASRIAEDIKRGRAA